jgi:hypothetical protein
MEPHGGMLCLACLEGRIRRPLVDSDFTALTPSLEAWQRHLAARNQSGNVVEFPTRTIVQPAEAPSSTDRRIDAIVESLANQLMVAAHCGDFLKVFKQKRKSFGQDVLFKALMRCLRSDAPGADEASYVIITTVVDAAKNGMPMPPNLARIFEMEDQR